MAKEKSSVEQAAIQSSSNPQPINEKNNDQLYKVIFSTLKNMPGNIIAFREELIVSEKSIGELTQQVAKIKEKLKPISKIDKRRGIKPQVTVAERSFLKSSLKRIEEQLFHEKENWSNRIREWNILASNDVKKTKSALWNAKASSYRYVNKNKSMIVNRTKSLFENLKSDPKTLNELKSELKSKDEEKKVDSVKKFLSENDQDGFLNTAYSAHEKLRTDFNDLFANILNQWTSNTKGFEFGNVNAEFKITRTGAKR